jgi:hypothetical protein
LGNIISTRPPRLGGIELNVESYSCQAQSLYRIPWSSDSRAQKLEVRHNEKVLTSVHHIKARQEDNASLVGLPLTSFTRLGDMRIQVRCYIMTLIRLIISADKWTCSRSLSMTQKFTYLPRSEANNRYFVAVLEG